jgi:penicillin-binding protein 2
VVAVVVENGRSGSGTAAPIARKVFDAYLLPPDGTAAIAEAPVVAPPPAAGVEE